jgi:hypothetical protein
MEAGEEGFKHDIHPRFVPGSDNWEEKGGVCLVTDPISIICKAEFLSVYVMVDR